MTSPMSFKTSLKGSSLMPATRSVLLKLSVRTAERLSRCSRNKNHEIMKGNTRFVVKEPGPGTPEKGYCAECGAAMLRKAAADVAVLQEELRSLEPND